jgi:hypothetical protein
MPYIIVRTTALVQKETYTKYANREHTMITEFVQLCYVSDYYSNLGFVEYNLCLNTTVQFTTCV